MNKKERKISNKDIEKFKILFFTMKELEKSKKKKSK
jgi:hypothetical protein